MDKGFHTGMILVDLQKTFDTLDHTVLLQKMECIGFKESVIKWFQSYLLNRKFFCDTRKCLFRCWTNKLCCSTRICRKATPLPNIYINDVPQAIYETGSYLYADDTCIFYQDKNVEKIEEVLNKKFSLLCEWFAMYFHYYF